jgi:uncharacterized membrane protein YjdF
MSSRPIGMYPAYIIQALIGFNILIAVYLGESVAIMSGIAGFLLGITPYLITRFTRIRFPWFVYFLISLAILIHISGYIQGRYLNIPNWDTLAHTVSGSIVSLLGFVAILFLDKVRKYDLDPPFIASFSLMFGLAGEYLWEIYEFLVDTFLGGSLAGKMQADNTDTMMDMIFVFIPSVIVALSCYYYVRKYRKDDIMYAMIKDSSLFSG